MSVQTHTALLAEANKQIDAIHAAFGAPGDYGYDTPQGQALLGLYRFRTVLDSALRAAPAQGDAA